MIEINLLPEEMRKNDTFPIRRIGALVFGALIVSGALLGTLSIHFGMLQKARAELGQSQTRLASMSGDVKYAEALTREKAEYTRRSETIQTISDSRILWTKKMDELFDVIDYGEKSDRHFVWLTELRVKPPRSNAARGAAKDGGELSIRGYSATEVLQKYSDFHEDVKNSPFFEDFTYIDDPAGKVVTFKDDVRPAKAWDFQLDMKLRPPGARKEADTRKKAPSSKPGE